MDSTKVMKLLTAMSTVHRLCRELGIPEVIDTEAAQTVITACIQRGPQVVSESIMAAFGETTKTIQ